MTHSIAFINQKGGVGKTTLVANAGAYWGMQGRRVLLIDLDPQSHLTLHFAAGADDRDRDRYNIYQALRGQCRLEEAVQPIADEGLDLIPSHIDLSAAEWELGQEVGREVILRDQLQEFLATHPYDIVLIDCPPSLGLLSLNALAAVDDVVVPVQAEFFALQGMAQLMRVVELVRTRLHLGLQWRVVVPTLVDMRTNLGREVIAELERHVPGKVTDQWLTKRVKVAEAPSFGQSIFTYAPGSPAAEEFEALCEELTTRLEFPEPSPEPRPRQETPPNGEEVRSAHAPAENDREAEGAGSGSRIPEGAFPPPRSRFPVDPALAEQTARRREDPTPTDRP